METVSRNVTWPFIQVCVVVLDSRTGVLKKDWISTQNNNQLSDGCRVVQFYVYIIHRTFQTSILSLKVFSPVDEGRRKFLSCLFLPVDNSLTIPVLRLFKHMNFIGWLIQHLFFSYANMFLMCRIFVFAVIFRTLFLIAHGVILSFYS